MNKTFKEIQEGESFVFQNKEFKKTKVIKVSCCRSYNAELIDILKEWLEYPKQEQSWKMFVSYLDKYHSRASKKSQFSAPIAAGYNIHRFDLKIIDRLSQKYDNTNKENTSNIFYPRDVIDVMNLVFFWFESNPDLKSYTMDSLRDYFGISKDGAHDAIKDVKDTADVMIRFMKLHRNVSSKVKFKNSFKS
jgi:DNA polymerase III epsilon subunit-like protein